MISKSVEETRQIAQELADKTVTQGIRATVIALSGDLGSGKTTFTKAFAGVFGIPVDEVTSPTFVIMKSYEINKNGFKKLIHIDAYRLEKAEEIEKLGWAGLILNPENLILIEWPENVGEVMPQSTPLISFGFVDENSRQIDFK